MRSAYYPESLTAIANAFEKRDRRPPESILDALATACAGYREGQSGSFPLLPSAPPVAVVGQGFVGAYFQGESHAELNRVIHRAQVRSTILQVLQQFGVGAPDKMGTEALVSLALGSWDPNTENARRDAIAGIVAGFYRAGLD